MKLCAFVPSWQKSKIITTFIFCFSACFSQSYKFENYTTRNGLVNNNIHNIAKDDDGFIWVGTNRGLSRFDGFQFKNYTHQGLRSAWISHILKDKSGKLWITTEGGICYYDKINDDFKYISSEKDLKIFGSAPMIENSKNELWLAGENGLFQVKNKQLLTTPIKSFIEPHTIFEDKKNRLWVGSNDGVTRYDPKTKEAKFFPLATPTWKYFVYAIFPENEHQIWLGTDAGLLLFDVDSGSFEQINTPEINKNFVVNSITNFQNSDQYISCGTANNGILIFDRKKRAISKQFSTSLSESNGLQTNTITTFFEDNQVLWIGTNLGLHKINFLNQQFQTVKLRELYDKKSLDQITRTIEDKTNKKFWWIATNDERGRLLYFDSENKKIVRFYQILPENNKKTLVSTTIRDMVFDKKGRLWIATFDGIYLFINGKFRHFPIQKNKNIDAYILKFDKNDKLWIGTENGLSVLDINTFDFEHHNEVFKNISFNKLDARTFPIEIFDFDEQNNIWIGISEGCIYYNPIQKKYKKYYLKNHFDATNLNRVTSIIYSKNNLIYSSLGGLLNLDLKTLKYQIFRPEKSFYVYSMVQDSLKNIWLSTYKGLCKIENKKVSYFNTQDGLYNDYSLYQICKVGDKFILGYTGAFSAFNPSQVSLCNTNLKPIISDVNVGKKQVNFRSQSLDYQNINLNYKENNITIKFTAIDFCNPEKIQFRYKLEGLENDWILADKNRQISYTNLDFKDYRFRLQVANEQSEWANIEANLNITVVPPFYQTLWFKLLTISVLCGLAYAFYRFRINQIIKLQLIRNRIAADLHDEVGSTLSSISIMSEMAAFKKENSREKLLEISNNAREMIDKMDDIVWAINPQNDEFYNLESRLKNYAIPLFESKGIEFKFEFPSASDKLKLNMEYRKNIYLIFKEAINNLVKYSLCKKVDFLCKIVSNQLIISVLDDGIGFDIDKKSDRNGLKNMKARAKNIGGELIISSKIDEGTSVKLVVDL